MLGGDACQRPDAEDGGAAAQPALAENSDAAIATDATTGPQPFLSVESSQLPSLPGTDASAARRNASRRFRRYARGGGGSSFVVALGPMATKSANDDQGHPDSDNIATGSGPRMPNTKPSSISVA